jgi:oligopeptidase B
MVEMKNTSKIPLKSLSLNWSVLMSHPIPKEIEQALTIHGETRIDPYFWLSDKKNKAVINHLKSENKYTDAVLAPHKKLRKALYKEMKARLKEDESSAPYFKNGYWYYARYEKGGEYALYCRKKGTLEALEELLLDENEMAADESYYEIDSFALTQNNSLLAFAEDTRGNRQYTIRFKDLNTNQLLDLKLENCESEFAWHADNETIYFILKEDETLRPYLVKSLNIKTGEEIFVYEEKDESFSLSIDTSEDYSALFLGCHSTQTTEFFFKSAHDFSPFQSFLPRQENHEYYPELGGDCYFIKTNLDAKNFKLVKCGLTDRSPEKWQTIQKHSEEALIEDFEVFDTHLVLQEKVNGLDQLRVYDRTDFTHQLIPPTEETFTVFLENNPESNAKYVRVGYSSLTTPHTIFDIDLRTFERTVVNQTVVLGDFNPDDYKSERIWAKAEDGTLIPVSLVYRSDKFLKNGKNPLFIHGYGAYGATIDPYFSVARLSLLDRGFIFAIAHVRGGEYLGTHWYEEGKLMAKKNTFTDFIAATEFLIHENYVDPNQVFAMGGSAGGLLIGAVANMRPDLWKGLLLEVPFLDVVTTMLDETLPLTIGEYDEWGNPNEEEAYRYMLSYSPYDQLAAKEYPPMYVSTGLHDSQVHYWEPTKYVAKLRKLKMDSNPILLRTHMKAGHGGASGRFEQLKEIAEEYTFILAVSGNKL